MLAWLFDLTPRERRTMGACFGGWAVDALDLQVFTFVIPSLLVLWNLTASQAGELATITLLTSALGGWIGGSLSDRFGRVRLLQITIFWYAIFTFLCGVAQDFTQLFIFRALQGLGFGGEWAAGAVLVGEVVRDRHRGRAVGLVQTGWPIGWGAAALLYTILIASLPEAYAWRALFWIGLAPASLVFWIRRFVEEPTSNPGRSEAAGAWHFFSALKPPYLATTWRVTMMVTGATGGAFALTIWLPTYLKTIRGISGVGTGGYLLFLILGALLGIVSGAYLADAIGRKKTFLLSAVSSMVVISIYLFAPISNDWILLVGFLLGYVSQMMFAPMGPFMTELYPTAVRGTGQGFCFNAGRGIGALFPALVGFLSSRLGLGEAIAAFSLAAYGIMLMALLLLPETRGRPLRDLEQTGDADAIQQRQV